MRRIWEIGATAVLTVGALSASVIVTASANGGPSGFQEVSAQSSMFGGSSFLSAVARTNDLLIAGSGPLFTCIQGCTEPQGIGRAEANGSTGRLRASGGSYIGGPFSGSGEAVIFDTITFPGPTATFDVDIDGSLIVTNSDGFGYAQMEFRIFIPASGGPEGQPEETLFSILAYEQAGIRQHAVEGFVDPDQVGLFSGIPIRFRYTVQVPLPPLLSNTLTVGFALSAGGACEVAACEASANYENTAYVKINGPYTSENGYVYAGRDDGAPVPEPAAWTLLGPAAALLALAARRRRVS